MRQLKGNRKLLIGFVLISCLILLGVGGKIYMDMREEKKTQELVAVEKQSVKVLKKTFADIAEVKIEQTGFNSMTGSYRMLVTMTNIEGKKVNFDYGFVKDSGEIGDYGVEDRSIQIKGITTNKVKVVYSNGEEEEL